jgi:hypothetical protein
LADFARRFFRGLSRFDLDLVSLVPFLFFAI